MQGRWIVGLMAVAGCGKPAGPAPGADAAAPTAVSSAAAAPGASPSTPLRAGRLPRITYYYIDG